MTSTASKIRQLGHSDVSNESHLESGRPSLAQSLSGITAHPTHESPVEVATGGSESREHGDSNESRGTHFDIESGRPSLGQSLSGITVHPTHENPAEMATGESESREHGDSNESRFFL